VIAHWDDVESGRAEAGHVGGLWADLGSAAGSKTVGVNRIRVDPGKWSTPFHRQTAEEEIFYVLGGTGVCLLDGAAFEVGPGDCIVHRPRELHALRADGDALAEFEIGDIEIVRQHDAAVERAPDHAEGGGYDQALFQKSLGIRQGLKMLHISHVRVQGPTHAGRNYVLVALDVDFIGQENIPAQDHLGDLVRGGALAGVLRRGTGHVPRLGNARGTRQPH